MQIKTKRSKFSGIYFLALCGLLHTPIIWAETADVEPEADKILKQMSVYLAGLKTINRDLIDDDLLEIELQYVDEEGTALPIGVYHMWAYQGPRQKSMVEPQVTLEYNLEPQIVLQGYDLATNEVQRSENLKLTLYWYAENTPDIDAKVFLHLYY